MKKPYALFLDRDGIINKDLGYVSKIEDFKFTEGIFELLHLFVEKGYLLFIVTNQSGIGRGYYTIKDFNALTKWMVHAFKEQNIEIQSVQHCPHTPNENCACRKPETGMVDAILKEYQIDLSNSWLIGDKQSDIDLAHNAGIVNTIAIGLRDIIGTTYQFETIMACKDFIEKNKNKLLQ